ncbi:MAG: hypothetical protein SGJ17_10185, partial [Hyphomicrobiales bacterium]|nr:hypothetical protein [Hyphomicrobiales bacterium]
MFLTRTVRWGAFILCALALCIVVARGQALRAQTEEPALREEGYGPKPDTSAIVTLRFITEGDYPPFNYFDEGGQ